MEKEYYMREALALARRAGEAGDVPVGAVVVRNGEIIGRGENRRERGGGASAHAEIEAINEACAALGTWRLVGCELYVTLEPCAMCAGAVANARLSRVVFGASDTVGGAFGGLFDIRDSLPLPSLALEGEVLADECAAILRSFFALKRAGKPKSKRLGREFFAGPALEVAPELLGKVLCRKTENGDVIRAVITETECYLGENDSASHARCGKTERNRMMYGRGGLLYVYLCYGIHSILNVVTGEKDDPQCVLIRAVEGSSGPGRVTKKFAIDRRQNGADVVLSDEVWIEDEKTSPREIRRLPRVGIDFADEADRARLWRFCL